VTTTPKLTSSTLKDFSARLCRFYKLPFGTQIILIDKKKRRKVRDDTVLKHIPINRNTLTTMPAPETTVARFLHDFVAALLVTIDLKERGHEIQLFGPDDEPCAGNKSLKSLLAMPAKETERERQKRLEIETQILTLRTLIEGQIRTEIGKRAMPQEAVCRAYVEAMMGEFGFEIYLDAFENADI
jgi:hypothetical protein